MQNYFFLLVSGLVLVIPSTVKENTSEGGPRVSGYTG
jgi:hypothetical protein